MRDARVLELVGEQVREAAPNRGQDVGAVAQQLAELEHQVAVVEASRLAQDAVVAGVEVGELDLALGALALGAPGRGALQRHPPLAQRRRRDRLDLQQVDATQQPRQQARRVAADLVTAKRQLVDPVEEDREPVRGANGGEERIEAGLERVVAQQALGHLLIGVDPELLVRPVEQLLGALAKLRARRARARQHENRLRAHAAAGECQQSQGERLGAPGAGDTEHQQRLVAVIGDEALRLGRRVAIRRHAHSF